MNQSSFRREEGQLKLFRFALNNIGMNWMMAIRDWSSGPNRFTIQFEDGTRRQ